MNNQVIRLITPENFSGEEFYQHNALFYRSAVRAVIADDEGRLAMQYSASGDFHKLVGGGIEEGETKMEALKREVREEAGLTLKEASYLGTVVEIRSKTDEDEGLVQVSYAYLATVNAEQLDLALDADEIAKGASFEWIEREKVLKLLKLRSEIAKEQNELAIWYIIERDIAIIEAA